MWLLLKQWWAWLVTWIVSRLFVYFYWADFGKVPETTILIVWIFATLIILAARARLWLRLTGLSRS